MYIILRPYRLSVSPTRPVFLHQMKQLACVCGHVVQKHVATDADSGSTFTLGLRSLSGRVHGIARATKIFISGEVR
jgi:hypothetical protein